MGCRENGFTDSVCSDLGEKGGRGRGEKRDRLLFFFFFLVAYFERPLWLNFLLSLLDEMIACVSGFSLDYGIFVEFCLPFLFSLS